MQKIIIQTDKPLRNCNTDYLLEVLEQGQSDIMIGADWRFHYIDTDYQYCIQHGGDIEMSCCTEEFVNYRNKKKYMFVYATNLRITKLLKNSMNKKSKFWRRLV